MILVIGGARSGKSSFAEKKAKELQYKLNTNVLYVATSIVFDEHMADRVRKHKESRPDNWPTLEQYKNFENIYDNEDFRRNKVILLDCLTLMVTNILLEYNGDFDKISNEQVNLLEKNIMNEVNKFIKVCKENNKEVVMVSNEVGFGLVPSYKLGSIFRDIAGRVNQLVAEKCEEVFLLTAGIPLKIK
ncbi:bifunctional adenosylcobinamide kinase/adenosylcobinamide-phosphate guanylyltransferase [Clostridium tarantellae]|uniref:Adenosylcobinamide kinase n=1 Tax=Clostridium tarantellae TaxID=39493 RepID=A0A6I1MMB6_9CLOT|nr:bifunctional adenosylcobinamide kinase/adenosylcobinamide-phosphate guanylyltransferase [Clostridium tarantellae]MPQ44154.1 bifunctional adenosylcobinamide kinase/adenosylcobinamide-phosphate guanylyltransferase [Clostridium tarantellae]